MIYTLVTGVLVPGKMAEWAEVAKELNLMHPKMGMKLVASWHGYTGNMNAVYNLLAYDDLAAYQKSREARQKNKEWQKAYAKMLALQASQTLTFLEPNAWSPMK